jgi:hypothetical protein
MYQAVFIDPAVQLCHLISVAEEAPHPISDEFLLLELKLHHEGFDPDTPHGTDVIVDSSRYDHPTAEPIFKVHSPLIIKSLRSLPDLPPEQWASLSICPNHQITITKRSFVHGFSEFGFVLFGNLRGAMTSISYDIAEMCMEHISWNTQGNTDLVAMAKDSDGRWRADAHFCHRAKPSPTQTSAPDLARKFNL